MKAIKTIPFYIILVVLISALLLAVSFGYAYYDKLDRTRKSTIQAGEWDFPYITCFESFTSADLTTADLDGKTWDLTGAVVGKNEAVDNHHNEKSLRMVLDSSITSTSGFKSAQSISFYFGRTINNEATGRPYELLISVDNSVDFTLVASGDMPDTFTRFELDISYIYTTGLVLEDLSVTVIDEDSIINFKFIFYGNATKAVDRQRANIDDIVIFYKQ